MLKDRDIFYPTVGLGLAIGALCAVAGAIIMSPLAKADGIPSGRAYATAPIAFQTGCYLKGHVQGSFVDHTMGATLTTVDGLSAKDAGLGLGLGCDYIYQNLLIGLFGDYTFQDDKFTSVFGGTTMKIPFGNEWSVGGRLGWLVTPRTNLYVLGAYTGVQDNTLTMTAGETSLSEALGNRRGGTVGGGFEILVAPNASLSLEYRHTAFGSNTASGLIPMTIDTREDSVRIGAAWRF